MKSIRNICTTKGHNSVNNVDGVIVLIFCTSSDNTLYLNQVFQNWLKGFLELLRGHNIGTLIYKEA